MAVAVAVKTLSTLRNEVTKRVPQFEARIRKARAAGGRYSRGLPQVRPTPHAR